jgi:hypothetical protein
MNAMTRPPVRNDTACLGCGKGGVRRRGYCAGCRLQRETRPPGAAAPVAPPPRFTTGGRRELMLLTRIGRLLEPLAPASRRRLVRYLATQATGERP